MLILKNIVKDYVSGDAVVHALRGVSLSFRENEFVSILGHSGCGKTTLLNIIGGLDRYTDGDLVINGRSTKDYSDADWDSFRNHSIGFVFQSYNLIPHQTVLANVELALTLSGVSRAERKRRAVSALERVGLGDQLRKRPNQMSGGQMQRVAIARALVNDPDVLLADEPTGALDSETSTQVISILKEVAREKLVIMVTHNAELAEKYSTRIVRLLDGEVIDDTDPCEAAGERPAAPAGRTKRAGMSLGAALSLSLNNLLTKKTRTILTAFAGSIGIIGIALIMSLSSGIQSYIDRVQEDTLSTYPIDIEAETMDMSSMLEAVMGVQGGGAPEHELDAVYSSEVMSDLLGAMFSEVRSNNLAAFKTFIEDESNGVGELVNDIKYRYDADLYIYSTDTSDGVVQTNPSNIYELLFGESGAAMSEYSSSSYAMPGYTMDAFTEMMDNEELLSSQYDVVAGEWADEYDEVVLIVDENNELSDLTLYTLGLRDQSELSGMMKKVMSGETISAESSVYGYDELLGLSFALVPPTDRCVYDEAGGIWKDMSDSAEFMKPVIENAVKLRVVGIVRPAAGSVAGSMSGAIGYTPALTRYYIDIINDSEIVKAQLEDPDTDVFTGIPFSSVSESTEYTIDDVNESLALLPDDQRAMYEQYFSAMTDEQVVEVYSQMMAPNTTSATYKGNLARLGVADPDSPSGISLYAKGFDEKDELAAVITAYNTDVTNAGNEELVISYTDYVGLIMSSVSRIINIISYVLIGFVGISLVVSSIMIGIITYISVLERTKEIGILRSIGASKRDISRVFNAETLIVGFASGIFGICAALLLLIPINLIIRSLSDISGLAALPAAGAGLLVALSMLLTFIAGLIPSRLAAKKDPVVALRTE